jgi:hypothetical protein
MRIPFRISPPPRRRPGILAAVGMLALCLVGTPAPAEVLVDLYSARVAVESRSTAAISAARRDGLAEVLVKASGNAAAASQPETLAALREAENYLLSYSFEEDREGLTLRLDYDENAVQGLLRRAGLPLWTANRPPVLAWLVVSDAGRRSFLGPEERPEDTQTLRERFSARGIPLQLPLLDLADLTTLSPGAAWRQSSSAIVEASRRYRGSEVLAGRVARTATGRWIGDWQLLYEGRWVRRAVDADDFDGVAAAGADLAASAIAGRYAVTQVAGDDLRHRLTLRGIREYADYRAALEALGSLEAVRQVVPEELVGDQVSLRVEADADLVQLARIVELDRRFVPAPAAPGNTGLIYEWMR